MPSAATHTTSLGLEPEWSLARRSELRRFRLMDTLSTQAIAVLSSGVKFGPVHIIHPRSEHTHTIIFLHGRGNTGEELCEELLATHGTDGRNIQEAFPGFRMVFPTAPSVWSHTFAEYTPAWLETFFLDDDVDEDYVTADGIILAVPYLMGVVGAETDLLGGQSDRVMLAGISEGGSVGMWTLLCLELPGEQRLGGFIGINTTLPFAPSIQRLVRYSEGLWSPAEIRLTRQQRLQDTFVGGMLESIARHLGQGSHLPLLRTPVFLYHGTDDALVDAEPGREAYDTFNVMGFFPKWSEYSGAEEMGHWIKEPEGIDDICSFIRCDVLGEMRHETRRAVLDVEDVSEDQGGMKPCRILGKRSG
ncbi:hypothetical protein HIM_04872 [Hirsutella minnesotensis 3608]|uniref:Phospholipase/carboxylesterase/thioesterase domain-containing protein n=1 Tax=Hirsutella minnesotensis 3608 TaxID=1043627 RepID=A0A0F7ZPL6_9HYPO|nr:hypothetical protein HIM_04872 [Hirsutella minnesotensis 3608]